VVESRHLDNSLIIGSFDTHDISMTKELQNSNPYLDSTARVAVSILDNKCDVK
jgi:hypothetical protein